MKIKLLSRAELYRSVRKNLPPPQRVIKPQKGGKYDRKYGRVKWQKEIDY